MSFRSRLFQIALLSGGAALAAQASDVGKVYPSEKTYYVDPVTHLTIQVLTSGDASDSKPYQTHTTWTSDGQWIVFRSTRGGHGGQAFLVNETNGRIIQLTDEPAVNTGSLNLSRKRMALYFMRGGPQFGRRAAEADAPPPAPRQLVELNLEALIADALAGTPKDASAYQHIVVTLPEALRDSGGFVLDADESKAYWGVSWGPMNRLPTPPVEKEKSAVNAEATVANASIVSDPTRKLDDLNTDPTTQREAARKRFAEAGKGPGGIRSIDLKTGEIKTVIDVPFRMGHVQANTWVPGEIIYCNETTGDAPQRMWIVRADGSENRPLYVETPDEWITHETVSGPDEVMFSIMGHLPYLRLHPTGIAVINLRNNQMEILGQVDETMPRGGTGGFWHVNGSPDHNWAVGDTFKGNIFVIDRKTGERFLLTTDHKMKPDHTHPIFSPDSRRVLIQSGHLTDGKRLNLMEVELPTAWLQRN